MARHDVPGVEGAFVLTNVLTQDECLRLAAQSEVRRHGRPLNTVQSLGL